MRWPILDHGLHLSALHAEATDDLAEKLEEEGLIAFGDIEFVIESADHDGHDVLELHAAVDVVPYRKDAVA